MNRKALLLSAAVLLTSCGHGAPAPAPAPVRAAPSDAPGPNAVAPMSPADRPTTMRTAGSAATNSLYARLGGVDAIRAVVHEFTGRVAGDERIRAFFRGIDMPHLDSMLTDQICVATGGPCTYRGKSMRDVHTGMNLTDAHFNALVEDLAAALDRFNVPPAEKGQLLGALGNLKGDIVGR
jgi:hemoglobin